jgi:enamine deaminase RidA (YjgF/YER057c/UK114 family)
VTIISRTVERGSMVYVQAATSEPARDIQEQTRKVLERIDQQLALAGSGKSKLLYRKGTAV